MVVEKAHTAVVVVVVTERVNKKDNHLFAFLAVSSQLSSVRVTYD